MVQEGRWGYGENSLKIWCGEMDCEVRRTKCSEGHKNGKPQIRQKEELEKKKKNWSGWYSRGSTIETFPFESETRPLDRKYLRKGSTCLNTDQLHPYIGRLSSILSAQTTEKRYC